MPHVETPLPRVCRTCENWQSLDGAPPHGAPPAERGRCLLHQMLCPASHSCRFWNSNPQPRYDD